MVKKRKTARKSSKSRAAQGRAKTSRKSSASAKRTRARKTTRARDPKPSRAREGEREQHYTDLRKVTLANALKRLR